MQGCWSKRALPRAQTVGLHGAPEAVAAFIAGGEARRRCVEPFDQEQIGGAFTAIDLDDSGAIDFDELLAFGHMIGMSAWTPAACEALLQKVDTDGDRRISREEFATFVAEVGLHGCHAEVDAFVRAGKVGQTYAQARRVPTQSRHPPPPSGRRAARSRGGRSAAAPSTRTTDARRALLPCPRCGTPRAAVLADVVPARRKDCHARCATVALVRHGGSLCTASISRIWSWAARR